MPVHDNEALIRRWIEGVNRRDPAISAQVVSPDYRMNGLPFGPKGARLYSETFLQAFPDWHAEIEELIAHDDKVVVRLTYTGTHEGELRLPATGRLAPTGKKVNVPSIELYHLANGQVTAAWIAADRLVLLQQLGALSTGPLAAPVE